MTDSRRDFLLRFAATALAAAGAGCESPAELLLPERGPMVVSGPPPGRGGEPETPPAEVYAKIGSTVFFGDGRLDLSPAAKAILDRQTERLKPLGRYILLLHGHCDERGTHEYNLAIGQRRAEAVRKYLTAAGIPPERITTLSFGKERPADSGHTKAAWARNRRVDVVVEAP